jgi:glycosyltransferase involved in cell wall biosynthesis
VGISSDAGVDVAHQQPDVVRVPTKTVLSPQTRRRTWSLVVSTYKREKILPRCIRCAVNSTRRPIEVIVVDASPYWQTTRDAVLAEFEAANPDIHFVYVGARRASLTAQRNQGLEMATGDVSFMLDDDSLLFPDSAERIMEVFDADVRDEVVALTPVFASDVPDADAGVVTPGHPTKGNVGVQEWRANPVRRLIRWLLWSNEQLLPYDGQTTFRAIPEHLQKFGLIPSRFSSGSAVFRTETVRRVKFEEMLERYAAGEDWDISERIKPDGLIAWCPSSRQCHLEAPGGRLSKLTVNTLRYLNFMALHVLHSKDVDRSRRLYRQFLWRRVISEALSDLTKRNWRMSRARGTWRALRMLPEMFARSRDEMRRWYPAFQKELVAADTGEERPR